MIFLEQIQTKVWFQEKYYYYTSNLSKYFPTVAEWQRVPVWVVRQNSDCEIKCSFPIIQTKQIIILMFYHHRLNIAVNVIKNMFFL